ncbi:glycosyltransferase family protein [Rhodovibrionaceae bacterium A322]
MTNDRVGYKVLIYSHDSFGLGHLRRCREIAHALVESDETLSVLILSGSPVVGRFDFHDRVDYVRIPGVVKQRNGDYVSLKLPLDIKQTLELRAAIIQRAAEIYDPDLFLVDKEPLGLNGEVEPTLKMLQSRGIPCVLGLRDVMDDPQLLEKEWTRKQVVPALTSYYSDIWVYGLPQICDPLADMDIPASVRNLMTFTGYLERRGDVKGHKTPLKKVKAPYLLVTVGGGGDGEAIVDWVLKAYESDPDLPHPAVVLLGPFMSSDKQRGFQERVDRLDRVEALTFSAHIEPLLEDALGVVAMGGYNTFCELLSFDKRGLVIPRTQPRLEQIIRISRAQDLGLVRMLEDDGVHNPRTMATALRNLPQQAKPSVMVVPGLMDGRPNVVKLSQQWLARGRQSLVLANAE